MKQDSPLRKKQNYVVTEKHFSAIIERATAPRRQSLEAGRRDSDQAENFRSCEGLGQIYEAPQDSTPQPIKDAVKGLVTGMGLAAAVFTMVLLFLGSDPLWYAIWAVLCLFGWLWLDADDE